MVIRHLGGVDGPPRYRQFPVRQCPGHIFLVTLRQQLHRLYYPGNHIRRQIAAVRPRISQGLVRLIQALGRLQCLVRRKAQQAVCVPLQTGQVVKLRRDLLLPCGFRLRHCSRLPFYRGRDRFRVRFGFQVCVRFQLFGKENAFVIAEIRCNRTVPLGFEVFNFFPPFHKNRQRRGLHPADAQQRIVLQREGAAGIHSDQPVCPAAAPGAFIQPVIILSRADFPESFLNGLIRHGGNPKAFKRLFAAGFFIDIAENQFPFPPRVRCADQGIRFLVVDQFFDFAVLVLCAADHLQRNLFRQDRQRI